MAGKTHGTKTVPWVPSAVLGLRTAEKPQSLWDARLCATSLVAPPFGRHAGLKHAATTQIRTLPPPLFILFATYSCATIAARAMGKIAYLPDLPVRDSDFTDSPRHSALVRITHWITALSFLGLVLSAIPILLAHPRFYWGETGSLETPSLFDLPLPFVLEIPMRGPGRYLHFFFAWMCVLTGLVYVVSGFLNRHFRDHLLPAKADLSRGSIKRVVSNHLRLNLSSEDDSYNLIQRLSYLGVVFILFPLMIWTGLAMSPAVTSVFPFIVNVLGGQQSARTIHFFIACAVILFVMVHIAMVFLAGFTRLVKGMITGHTAAGKERS